MTEEAKGTSRSEFKINGKDLVSKLRELFHQGNIRHIIVVSEKGRTILEIPLLFGAVGVALAPPWAAVGLIAALVTKCSIVVIRDEPEEEE